MNNQQKLLQHKKKLFHTAELALLWNMNNKNTLYTTIKRYVKKGILIKIHKGFYATTPLKEIDPVKLGIAYIHTYAYLSTESVLAQKGVINQQSSTITLVSSTSKKFTLMNRSYIVRAMKGEWLYNDLGIEDNIRGYKKATLERAVADMLYYHPHFQFDAPNLIDWKKVKEIQKQINFQK